LAAELGAVAYTGAIYGHPGTVKRRRPPEDEFRWAAAGLHALAEHGAGLGVVLAIEPMSHFRTHVVNTPEQAMRLLVQADHPNLQVLLDTYHLVTEITDYADAVATVGDRLWGLHACENHRGVPGTGILPWADVARGLARTAFDGYVILETYNSGIGDFAWERGMFHDVCPDGPRFVRQSLAFLAATFAPRPEGGHGRCRPQRGPTE
jgi:D-psicose/D-tagatose/L-ribulose 3-epimerase